MAAGNHKEASELFPKTIEEAIEKAPVISDLILAVGKAAVAFSVEYEILQVANMVNVGGNITGGQSEFIATNLIDMFPYDSLADFKICFQRGAMGQYGEIFRLDGIVLRKWLEQYFEEKSETRERIRDREKKRERQESSKIPSVQEGQPGYEEFKKWAADLQKMASKPMYTNEELMKFKEKASSERAEYLRKTVMGSHADKPPTGALPMSPEEVEAWHAEKAKSLASAKERRIAELLEKHPTLTIEELNRLL